LSHHDLYGEVVSVGVDVLVGAGIGVCVLVGVGVFVDGEAVFVAPVGVMVAVEEPGTVMATQGESPKYLP